MYLELQALQAVKELVLLFKLIVGLVSVLLERHPGWKAGRLQADSNAIRGLITLCWRAAALQRAFHADMTGAVLAATPTYCSHKFKTELQMGRLVTQQKNPARLSSPCYMPDQTPKSILLLNHYPAFGRLLAKAEYDSQQVVQCRGMQARMHSRGLVR